MIKMDQASKECWDRGEKSGLISIGTHSLYIEVSGPDRSPGEPIIVLMQGCGSTINEWVVVKRLVQPFARFLCYDRSGLGKSESPPTTPEMITAVSVVTELNTLIQATNIEGPYIIVCHSWGGITSREFLHLRPHDVAGMVFVDANQEKTFLHHENFPPPCFSSMMASVNYFKVTGITADTALSDEEFQAVVEAQAKPSTQMIEAAEASGAKGDWRVLAAKKQLEMQAMGNRPVSVIHGNTARDFQRIYEAGVEAGNGTEKEREEFREMVDWWHETSTVRSKEILALSSVNNWRDTERSGHNIELIEPGLIVEEIKWVYSQLPQNSNKTADR